MSSHTINLSLATIAEISLALRAREMSPVALTDHCLDQIHAQNPRLNLFITVTDALAREQAQIAEQEIQAGKWRGRLHGVPVAVKDFYDTAGIRTTAAARQFANRVPAKDAVMVARLREAGAVLVGKTNMHKLGMGTTSLDSDFGPVVNPLSERHVAGGSSGGSAAAVAAGLCFATIDTDAVGSGRLPAAICGVSCLKPSFGVLSSEGVLAGEHAEPVILALSHPCVTARTADDVAMAFRALTSGGKDPSPADDVADVGGLRVGVVSNFSGTDDTRAAFDTAVASLASLGLQTVAIRIPFESARFDVSRIDADRGMINSTLFADVAALVLPTLSAPTPTVDEARAGGPQAVAPDNTFFCNYFGLPAMTVPAGLDAAGLPLGIQFVGPRGADDRVLSLARAFDRRPDASRRQR
jgi:aspartyl-tRNA(Asn)/glutamyl-tRNA(Gln) amidotransferase subunit A